MVCRDPKQMRRPLDVPSRSSSWEDLKLLDDYLRIEDEQKTVDPKNSPNQHDLHDSVSGVDALDGADSARMDSAVQEDTDRVMVDTGDSEFIQELNNNSFAPTLESSSEKTKAKISFMEWESRPLAGNQCESDSSVSSNTLGDLIVPLEQEIPVFSESLDANPPESTEKHSVTIEFDLSSLELDEVSIEQQDSSFECANENYTSHSTTGDCSVEELRRIEAKKLRILNRLTKSNTSPVRVDVLEIEQLKQYGDLN